MRKIKVLHVSTAKSWRGGEQQLAYLMQELNSELEQYVICVANSPFEKFAQENNFNSYSQAKSSGFDIPFAKRIAKICKEKEVDIVHTHDSHGHTFAFLSSQLFGNKVSIVVSRRVDFPIKKGWLSKVKYNHPSIKKVICVSNAIKEITKKGLKDHTKLAVVHSGIDIKKFKTRNGKLRSELGLNDSTYLIGNTSALADHKDYFTFLEVAQKLVRERKDFHFAIIGKGPLEKEIKQKALELNLSSEVSFIGFRNDIPEILADLDLFLITSKTEGLGTSIIDAFAAKIPVVATAAGGIPELVIDGETGLLNQVFDIDSLAESVLRIKEEVEMKDRIVLNAFNMALQFDKKYTAEKTLAIYQEILGL